MLLQYHPTVWVFMSWVLWCVGVLIFVVSFLLYLFSGWLYKLVIWLWRVGKACFLTVLVLVVSLFWLFGHWVLDLFLGLDDD